VHPPFKDAIAFFEWQTKLALSAMADHDDRVLSPEEHFDAAFIPELRDGQQ
jgi:hypothetical protein